MAAAMAWLGLALCAQAAHATYGKVTIVKINQGGDPNDTFGFHPDLRPTSRTSRSRAGSRRRSRSSATDRSTVLRDADYPTLTVTEKPTPGYVLKDITCVHKQGSGDWPTEPPGLPRPTATRPSRAQPSTSR